MYPIGICYLRAESDGPQSLLQRFIYVISPTNSSFRGTELAAKILASYSSVNASNFRAMGSQRYVRLAAALRRPFEHSLLALGDGTISGTDTVTVSDGSGATCGRQPGSSADKSGRLTRQCRSAVVQEPCSRSPQQDCQRIAKPCRKRLEQQFSDERHSPLPETTRFLK